MMFEDTSMETLSLAAETMFCATPDCDHVASVAVFRPGDKVITLACMNCVWNIIRQDHAPSDADVQVSIPPGMAIPDPHDTPAAIDSAAVDGMTQVAVRWLTEHRPDVLPPTA